MDKMSLQNETIKPVKEGASPFTKEEVREFLAQLSDQWVVDDDYTKIRVEFKFKNFKKALDFVNAVGEVADAAMHHPDITLGWGYAHLEIQTHSISGLHKADFVLAAKADALYQQTAQ
tara:strand:- start:1163 stop:1516 length:354 start_codon:yes stop_codon:yes gene_type:complete